MATTPDQVGQHIREGIRAEITPLFEDLRRFTDRRIAELSAELHATVQLVDFTEANLSGQLGKIHDQVAAMIAMPVAASRNSGLELEAVVQATEAAANQIMEAAEAIGDWLREDDRDQASSQAIVTRLNAIFEACSFQDVTGQRIRRAIQHLQKVEMMLTEVMPHPDAAALGQAPHLATKLAAPPGAGLAAEAGAGPDLEQGDVDRMFG